MNPSKGGRVNVQVWLHLKDQPDDLLIAEQYLDKGGWQHVAIPPVNVRDFVVESLSIHANGARRDITVVDDVILVAAKVSGRKGPLQQPDTDAPSAKVGEPIKLSGRETEAVLLAITDFKKRQFAVSADLFHYEIELQRHVREIEVTFVADRPQTAPESVGVGGGSSYGADVHYSVALEPLKIIRFHFYRD